MRPWSTPAFFRSVIAALWSVMTAEETRGASESKSKRTGIST
jgi:hypothetical protein